MNQEQLDRYLKAVTEEEKHPLDIYGLMKMYDLFPEIPSPTAIPACFRRWTTSSFLQNFRAG